MVEEETKGKQCNLCAQVLQSPVDFAQGQRQP